MFRKKSNQIIEARKEDMAVAKAYPEWQDKGPVIDGRRLTIMAKKQTYYKNEEVRIIHILEATLPGYEIYVMGPKRIFKEYVNDIIQDQEISSNQLDPFTPEEYDGRVLQSPGIDSNFEITTYSFTKPGVYKICWKPGKWESNRLEIQVKEKIKETGRQDL